MEKYEKPYATVETFNEIDVITASTGGSVTVDPGWDGEFNVDF